MRTSVTRLVGLLATVLAGPGLFSIPGPRTAAEAADSLGNHWVFGPVVQPAVPLAGSAWSQNPIDHFILTRLEKERLSPSPEADRRTLVRRLKFDLLGLPPTPEEVEAFVTDPGPDAYEKVVERFLASPHYGERWARH